MAIGVLKEARSAGLRVPEDLSVVGFDGIDATAWTQPGLTTIEQPVQDIAETAVNALKSLVEEPDRPLPNFLFRPQLRVRASTAPPAA
jgi:LacI family transcriptional regulator